MRRYLVAIMLAAMATAVYAAQKTTFTQRDVRDPRKLAVDLAANAADVETRVSNLESSTSVTATVSGDFTVTSNLTVSGTAAVVGVATFRAESGHTGGIAANYLTVDAAAGVDTKTAGALKIGAATATSVEVGATDAVTKIMGGVKGAYAAKTANYTATANDFVLSYTTSAATTNTLPEASTVLGSVFAISLFSDTGDLVVVTDGTDKFDGAGNYIVTMADAGDSLIVMATAANAYTILVNVGGTLSGAE